MHDALFTNQVASLFEAVSVPPQAVQLWFWACVVVSVWLVMLIRSEPRCTMWRLHANLEPRKKDRGAGEASVLGGIRLGRETVVFSGANKAAKDRSAWLWKLPVVPGLVGRRQTRRPF